MVCFVGSLGVRADKAATLLGLLGNSFFLCDHIVILDHWRTLPLLIITFLASEPWAPVEELIDLELNQGQQEYPNEEVNYKDDAVTLQVVPCPDVRWNLPGNYLTIVSRILGPRIHDQGA